MTHTNETEGTLAVAQALLEARRARRPVAAAPLEQALRHAEDAYWVQDRVARDGGLQDAGVPRHWKSGGPNRTAVLTHAPLPPAGVWTSPATAGDHPFNFRVIEAEIALRLARDVTPQDALALTPEQAPQLIEAMTVSIEVVDSRWSEGGQAPALLKLADLQSHGALVLSAWQPFVARDWSQQTCVVRIGGGEAQTFRGTHTLADPAWLLPTWLRHVSRGGATVPAGSIVTTGSWCGMLKAAAGDRVHVMFEGIGEAQVQL